MSWRQHLARMRTLFLRRDPPEDLDQEIRSHLEFAEEENRALGMSQEEARYAARHDFGNVAATLEEARNRWVYRRLEDCLQDVRYGLRTLAKSREFAVVSVLTLALGISANTAMFSFADLIIRRPVALPELDRLAAVSEYIPLTEQEGISYANYLDLEAHSRGVAALAAYQFWSAALTRQGEPEEVRGVRVTENFFSALKLRPALGRTFLPEEAQSANEHVLVISNDFWKRQFGGSSAVIGKTLELNQRPYTIVGVMPPKTTFPLGAPAFWTPLAFTPQDRSERIDLALNVVGRLAPGATLEQARAEFETLWAQMQKDFPRANASRSLRVTHLTDEIVKDYNVEFTLLLLGVVAFVLLIACANVAGLQLARAAGRQPEVAVRACLGASRGRLMTQFVTESVLLAAIGGLFGLLLALWGVHLLRVTLPPEVQGICNLQDLRVDSASLLFTLVVTFFAGVLSGIAPAWQMSRSNLHRGLREGESRLAGGPSHHLRRLLVIGETALALVLLIGAGLMVKGFAALLHGNPSLAPDSLLTLHISLRQAQYGKPFQKKEFYDQLLSRLQALPTVESAALASGVPYSFYDESVTIRVPGRSEPPSAPIPAVMAESISPDYFRALHIPLREGRGFDARDSADTAPVAVVSESIARAGFGRKRTPSVSSSSKVRATVAQPR
jgi:putative ABC transport system permease protein